jgi:hypothetical protein
MPGSLRDYTVAMLLVTHILIALTSIAFSSLAFFAPSRLKLQASYGLVAATLVSGTWLVLSTGSPLLSSCMTGLVYLAASMGALIMARRKLVAS